MDKATRRRSIVLVAMSVSASLAFGSGPAVAATCANPAFVVRPSANAASGDSGLAAVDIIARNDVWAVGSSGSLTDRDTLIEHWNGRRWSIVPSPNGSQPVNWLTGVSAVSPTDVWAVGFTNDGNGFESQSFNLILHYDGTGWTEIPAPNPVPNPNPGGYPVSNELYAVHAVSANDVWAVGHLFTYTLEFATILHWNGTQWSNVSPQLNSRYTRLRSIDSAAANDVWAVGEIQRVGTQRSLMLHFNGSAWTLVPSPNASVNVDYVSSVSVASSSDVWAVGYYNEVFGAAQRWQTTSWHWNGTAWSVVDAPDFNQLNNYLRAVVALSPTNAFAVGFWDTGSKLRTMAQHWNGTRWAFIPSSNAGDLIDELVAVDAAGGSMWAVGQYAGAFNWRTLTERFTC